MSSDARRRGSYAGRSRMPGSVARSTRLSIRTRRPYTKFRSQIRMSSSGQCFILPMPVIKFHRGGSRQVSKSFESYRSDTRLTSDNTSVGSVWQDLQESRREGRWDPYHCDRPHRGREESLANPWRRQRGLRRMGHRVRLPKPPRVRKQPGENSLLLTLPRSCSDEILKAAERKSGGSGPASSPAIPAAVPRPGPSRPSGPTPQATSRSLPNGSHSSPTVPSAQASRPSNQVHAQHAYDPTRARSTELPRAQAPRQVPNQGYADPRYQGSQSPANPAGYQHSPQGNRPYPPPQAPTRYGPGGQPASHGYAPPARGPPTHHQGRI